MTTRVEQCRQDLANITEALVSGVRQVSVDGVQTTFGSMKELRTLRNELQNKLNRLEGKPTRKRYSSFDLSGGC